MSPLTHALANERLIFLFRRKRKPKIFGLENWMERGVRKTLNFVKVSITSKISGETNTDSPVFLRGLKLSQHDRTDTNLIAPLRMY